MPKMTYHQGCKPEEKLQCPKLGTNTERRIKFTKAISSEILTNCNTFLTTTTTTTTS